ncbi:Ribosomal protein L2 [Cynara cardunculus var. scolymus]|uniref:Ribosomal protein L2 n=1 Tax=Cynara cardunculus var. scolymus TaxID=59895 RepID=A0A118K0X6_CYNCS|nr:Ribosomal protein L2 [Cynara cardunculus var. scolymus]
MKVVCTAWREIFHIFRDPPYNMGITIYIQKAVCFGRSLYSLGRESTSTDMPLGTTIHNIEITLGKGGQLARAAGAVVKLIAKEGKSNTLKLPSGEVHLISKN